MWQCNMKKSFLSKVVAAAAVRKGFSLAKPPAAAGAAPATTAKKCQL